jgi:hypothetical protein
MGNAWDGVSTPARRRNASRVLVVVGSVLSGFAVLSVVAYATFLDTSTFAAGVDAIRKNDAVSEAVGRELTQQIIAGRPDLVAVRPLVEQVTSEVAGSDLLTPLVTRAATEVQRAATSDDGGDIALRLVDAGAVAAAALRAFVPEVADQVPAELSVTLAEVGAGDIFAGTVRTARYLSIAAWLLPVVALTLLALAVWVSPNQRKGLVRVGIGTLVVGAVLGLLTLAVGIGVAALDTEGLTGALADAAWQEWSRGFWVATAAVLVVGAVITSAAAALLPDVDVADLGRRLWVRVGARPVSTEGIAARGVLVALLGLALVVAPLRLLTWGTVLLGLAVIVYGVSEVTSAAVKARVGEPAASPPAPPDGEDTLTTGWSLGILVAAVVLAVGAGTFWVVQGVRTHPADAVAVPAGTGDVCNGHAELCNRTYDEVAYVTTHNAMSVADEPGWYLAEQPHDIVSQLDGGARALMLDVWRARPAGDAVSSLGVNLTDGRAELEESFEPEVIDAALRVVDAVLGPPTGPSALYLCHGLCEIGATPLAPTLDALRSWLERNPDEVVTLIVENHVPAAEIGQAIVAAGLERYLHRPQSDRWPTLFTMVTSGRRLVVVTEEGSGGPSYPWLVNAFELIQDTPYTFDTVDDFTCDLNRGQADAPLLLVNHWLSGFTSIVTAAEQVNAQPVLGARVAQCADERGTLPNFVGVNYYTIGDVRAVVADLNQVAGD